MGSFIFDLTRVKRALERIPEIIDHTLLKPIASRDEVLNHCSEARKEGVRAFCVSPYFVKLAKEALRGSQVRLCTVVGFPLGFEPIDIKALEASRYLETGADEIDMVANLHAIKMHNWEYLREEISRISEIAHEYGASLKVIIETGYLDDHEMIMATEVVAKAKADFVKTCTGFGPRGVSLHDIAIIAPVAHRLGIGVKAAGGIRRLEELLALVAAGADIIGTSSGLAIIKAWKALRGST